MEETDTEDNYDDIVLICLLNLLGLYDAWYFKSTTQYPEDDQDNIEYLKDVHNILHRNK